MKSHIVFHSVSEFLSLITIDILDQIILCHESLSYPKMFCSIPGLFPLDVSSAPLSCDNQKKKKKERHLQTF